MITQFNPSQNPVLINTPVTFTINATDADTATLNYMLNFGATTTNGAFSQGVGTTVTQAFAAEGTYTLTLSVDDGNTTVIQSLDLVVVAPSSGGLGVPNISQGTDTVTNPVDNLAINVMSSDGGVIVLSIDVSALTARAPLIVQTDWGDVAGRSSTAFGLNPVHKYIQHGVFVATVTAKDATTGAMMGKGRKTLAVSAKETGEVGNTPLFDRKKVTPPPGPLLNNSSNTAVTQKSFAGKLLFTGSTKSDTVTFNGSFYLPVGFNPLDTHEFSMAMGNIVVNANLDTTGKGKAISGTTLKSLKLGYKLKKGAVAMGNETATLSVTFTAPGLVNAGFDTEGISKNSTDLNAKHTAPRKIQVAFTLDGAAFEALAPVMFTEASNSDFGTISGRSGP